MDFFSSRHGSVKIAYSKYLVENPRYKMLFLVGRAEFFKKYEFLFEILNNFGVSVYTMDHRGQGASGRLLDDPYKGHVEKFSHYVDDAEDFLESVVMEDGSATPVASLSHSMGGTVSLVLASRKKNIFDKIIFSSPMWGINLGGLSHKAASILSKVMVSLGKGESYLPGKKGNKVSPAFENNQLTHSLEKFERQKDMVEKEPNLAVGGPTYSWLFESLKTIDEIRKKKFDTGATHLLLQAEKDSIVDNKYQDKVIADLKSSQKYVVKGSWHEILYEDEIYFRPAVEKIFSFLERDNF